MEQTFTKTREEWYIDYMDYRNYCGRKKPANDVVRQFLNWCNRNYAGNDCLTQEMVDTWAETFSGGEERSVASRAMPVNALLNYLNNRKEGPYNLIDYNSPKYMTKNQTH